MKASRFTKWLETHRPQLLIFAAVAFLALFIAGAVNAPAVAVPTAFLTLIVGIAAQQSLGNIFAGIMLALSHPFKIGDTIKLPSLEGTVFLMGIVYTVITVGTDEIYVPNSTMLSSVVTVEHPKGT